MCPTLSFILVKHVLYLIKALVILGVLFILNWSFFPKAGFGQGGFNKAPQIQWIIQRVPNFMTTLYLNSHNSFKFPTLTTSKQPGSNTLNSWLLRLSSPPLPQVSGLGRTPLTRG